MNSRLVANVGTLAIGGDNPVRVQTMYDDSIKDTDPQLVVDRINTLAAMGCDLIRFSYVSSQDGENFRYITSRSPIPVVADIHFDYRLALEAMDNGAQLLAYFFLFVAKNKEFPCKLCHLPVVIVMAYGVGNLLHHAFLMVR